MGGGGGGGAGNGSYSAANNIYGDVGNMLQTYGNSALSAYAQELGYDPSTGQFQANYNPLTSGNTGKLLESGNAENTAQSYTNAISSTNHDLAGRGMAGANSLSADADASVRDAQASQNSQFNSNLAVEGQQMEDQGLSNLYSGLTGQGMSAANGEMNIGNEQNQAQEQSNSEMGGMFGSLMGAAGSAGGFGSLFSGL
nr:hypothetical protein [uncultured Rhodopila sp.]